MGATPFKSVSWNDNDPILTEKLNQMTNNEQWLFENTPRIYFRGAGQYPNRGTGVKLLAGFSYHPATKTGGKGASVFFNNTFTTGVRPAVVATPIVDGTNYRAYASVHGHGTALLPDHRGFWIRLVPEYLDAKRNRIFKASWCSWIAVGY